MKLRNIAKGTRAVKTVAFRLANAPLPTAPLEPGQLPDDEYTIKVGVRVLTGAEVAEVYEKALARAQGSGVKDWLDTHPLCRLYEMAHTLAVACVDIDAPVEPFFASVDEVLNSPEVGGDNIAFLYEQHANWQDECSFNSEKVSLEQALAMIAEEAERPENSPDSPFSRLRPSMRRSLWHSTCALFKSYVTVRLLTGSTTDLNSSELQKSLESPE